MILNRALKLKNYQKSERTYFFKGNKKDGGTSKLNLREY